jgi:hypothetical protein
VGEIERSNRKVVVTRVLLLNNLSSNAILPQFQSLLDLFLEYFPLQPLVLASFLGFCSIVLINEVRG